MKGLVILAALTAVIGGALYALMRPSDVDLERVEQDIEQALSDAGDSLADVVRILNPLRAINPTLQALDADLAQRRDEVAALTARLEQLKSSRPNTSAARGRFLSERRQVRADANRLVVAAGDLRRRAELTDQVMREIQPRVQTMLAMVQALVTKRDHYEAANGELTGELALKVDQIVERAQKTRSFAAQSRQVVMRDVADGESMAKTVKNDVEQVIVDLQAAGAAIDELAQGG